MGTDDGFLERYLQDFHSDLLKKPGSGARWHDGQKGDAGGQNARALDSRSRIIRGISSILKGIRDGCFGSAGSRNQGKTGGSLDST